MNGNLETEGKLINLRCPLVSSWLWANWLAAPVSGLNQAHHQQLTLPAGAWLAGIKTFFLKKNGDPKENCAFSSSPGFLPLPSLDIKRLSATMGVWPCCLGNQAETLPLAVLQPLLLVLPCKSAEACPHHHNNWATAPLHPNTKTAASSFSTAVAECILLLWQLDCYYWLGCLATLYLSPPGKVRPKYFDRCSCGVSFTLQKLRQGDW